MDDVIKKILEAKEERAKERTRIADQGRISLSMTINIPGYPKSDDLIKLFFNNSLSDLKRYLLSHRISIETDQELKITDQAGDFYLVPILKGEQSAKEIKSITETFETEYPLGRLLDVDITDQEGNPVSSGKAKLCYFCNQQPAVYCMRTKSHGYEEMRGKIETDIQQFLKRKKKERVCKDLASFALKSLLHEVSLSPKPGLVDRFSNGSHTDMDFATFLNSSAVLSVYFKDIAEFGYSYAHENIKDALPKLRQIGLQMEEDMFRETNGVNTHKGAIFLLGFSLFVSAYLIAQENFSYTSFVDLIRKLNGDLVERELGKKLYSGTKTHGEECFEKYGAKGRGIRGEIQAGLPCVFQHSIPVLTKHLQEERKLTDALLQKCLTHALLALIANNDDSNILYRKGERILDELKDKSQQAFESFETDKFEVKYQELIDFCHQNHISPGGSADLLAVSMYVFTANQKYGLS